MTGPISSGIGNLTRMQYLYALCTWDSPLYVSDVLIVIQISPTLMFIIFTFKSRDFGVNAFYGSLLKELGKLTDLLSL